LTVRWHTACGISSDGESAADSDPDAENAMSKKHHGGPAPVPPSNRPQTGPSKAKMVDDDAAVPDEHETGTGFNEQDPQRRLGGYESAGEHSIQQPSDLNDGTKHSK
jgi:hypothetical protein